MTKKTKDLYLFAAYLSLGAELTHVNRTDPKNMEFTVELKKIAGEGVVVDLMNTPDSKHDINLDYYETQWVNGTLLVPAVKYADAIRRAKSLVHSKNST